MYRSLHVRRHFDPRQTRARTAWIGSATVPGLGGEAESVPRLAAGRSDRVHKPNGDLPITGVCRGLLHRALRARARSLRISGTVFGALLSPSRDVQVAMLKNVHAHGCSVIDTPAMKNLGR